VCVTLPASPKTVRARRGMLLLAQLCMFTSLEEWLPQETTAGQRLGKMGVRPSDESRPQLDWLRSSTWSKAALGLPANAGGVMTMPSSSGINRLGQGCASDQRSPNYRRDSVRSAAAEFHRKQRSGRLTIQLPDFAHAPRSAAIAPRTTSRFSPLENLLSGCGKAQRSKQNWPAGRDTVAGQSDIHVTSRR
jgi:hypothetical protein